jgi:hypothetical protein
VRNKMTRELRENILRALGQAIKGETDGDLSAVEYLVRLARRKNPALFVALLGKTIEKKVQVSADLRQTVRIVNLTGLDLSDPKIRKRLGPSILGQWPSEESKK